MKWLWIGLGVAALSLVTAGYVLNSGVPPIPKGDCPALVSAYFCEESGDLGGRPVRSDGIPLEKLGSGSAGSSFSEQVSPLNRIALEGN